MGVVKIGMEKLVYGGQCLGRLGDKVVFVWNALPGEEVEVEITKEKKNFAEGAAVKILKPSAERVEPRDEHYLSCGPWQILSWPAENEWKIKIAKETFLKFGGFTADNLHIAHDNHEYNYRNKMEYGFDGVAGNLSLTMSERGTHEPVLIKNCALAGENINEAAAVILAWANENNFAAEDLRELIIRENNKKEILAALVAGGGFRHGKLSELSKPLVGFHIFRADYYSDKAIPTEKLGGSGLEFLTEKIKGAELRFGPFSFFQINTPLFEMALQDIEKFLDKNDEVLDFYSGVGAISLPLAAKFKNAVLVENNREAARYAGDNIALNKLGGKCRAEHASAENAAKLIIAQKTVIFDPPRAGLDSSVKKRVLETKPRRIIYLSCDIATQARDIKDLSAAYKISFLKLYNFFPRTPHIEGLCVLDLI